MGGIMLMSLLPETVVDGGEIPNSDLYWEVTKTEEGAYTLTISGEGAMPDYTDTTKNYAPWRISGLNAFKLVFGEGVTTVGAYAFRGMNVTSIQFSSTITAIGSYAFYACGKLTSVTIPGTVKTVGNLAFSFCQNLTSITLEEGVEALKTGAFSNCGRISEFYIPSTVTTIEKAVFQSNEAYKVSESNPKFTAVDGILYTKDMKALVDYPKFRAAEEYVVPDEVTTLRNDALCWIAATVGRIVIPATVQSAENQITYGSSGIKELYIENGALAGKTYGGLKASGITTLRLPENTALSLSNTLQECTSLKSFTIPNGTSSIGYLSTSALPLLKEIIYDASNAKFTNSSVFTAGTSIDLTIGPNVTNLQSTFSYLAAFAEHIYFIPETQFTIQEGAFDAFGEPLASVSGTAWVDDQGCLYIYDATAGTAKLVYCPPNKESIIVPATISIPNEEDPGNPTVCTVNSVGQDALACAEDLAAITFAAPEKILTLEFYALGNCPTLTSVNGKTSVGEALASFTNAVSVGWGVLFNTGLTDAETNTNFGTSMAGSDNLTYQSSDTTMNLGVSSTGVTGQWQSSDEGTTGGYHLLTGDSITFTAVAENKAESSGSSYCRIYLRLTDSTGGLSITPGETYTFNTCTATCYSTEDPLTVYLEFQLKPGDTISVPVKVVYPTPSSGGGGVTVWGMILGEAQAAESQNKLVDPPGGSTLQAYWDTQRETFEIAKKPTDNAGKGVSRNIIGDTSTGEVTLNGDPEWYINCVRQDEAATYGRDPVEYIDYTDTFILPEGITLKEDVITGLTNGTTFTWSGASAYMNGIRVFDVGLAGYNGSSTGSLKIMNVTFKYDETTRTITTTWRVKNISATSAQIPSFRVLFRIGRQGLDIDPDAYMKATNNVAKCMLTNEVDAVLHYRYSSVDQQQAKDEKNSLVLTNGICQMGKSVTEQPAYFGEGISWQIYLQNTGALPYVDVDENGNPYSGEFTIYDALEYTTYIKPENMEKMFQEEYGQYLTITISNAQLAPYEPVKDVYGGTSYRTTGNSDLSDPSDPSDVKTGQTLTVKLAEDGAGYVVSAGDSTYLGSTAAEALQAAGYAVTTLDQYTCTWIVNPDTDSEDYETSESQDAMPLVLPGGERWEYNIYATVKDTFTMLNDRDWRVNYPPDSTVTINNNAQLLRPNGKQARVSNTTTVKGVRYEAYIDKSGGVVGGGQLTADEVPSVLHGDMMEYTLYLTHYGKGVYENLPLVDDLYGSQYLLVPKAKNPSLAGLKENGDYYVLPEGEYTNVTVGKDEYGNDCIAASIIVDQEIVPLVIEMNETVRYSSGIHTRIKWYYSKLQDTGAYQTTITYNTLVDTENKAEYALGNLVFANDKTGYRIWEGVWGDFTQLNLKKDIVTERGETAAEDTVDEDELSTVEPGSQVTYRLMLQNTSTVSMTLTGNKTADGLPSTAGVFEWVKDGNVTIQAAPESADRIDGLEKWYLDTTYQDFEEAEGQQYIRWPDTTKFHFEGGEPLYLYVTLTFPSAEGENSTWDAYCSALKGDAISNKLYIYKQRSSVTHYLADPGEVLLQKGVYAVTHSTGDTWWLIYTPSRSLYQNEDASKRQVVYYATLYNGAAKRLYLNDMMDYLPKGFSYLYLCGGPDVQNKNTKNVTSITTIGGLSSSATARLVTSYGTEVTYRSAKVTAQHTGGRDVTFKFSAGSGEYAVKYDETLGKYYLDQGEAIVFGYACTVGSRIYTEDTATNTLSMAYTDYNGTGVELTESQSFLGSDVSKVSSAATIPTDQNDGSNLLLTAAEAEKMELRTTGDSETYLASTVSVTRGGIQPGISKAAVSYTSPNSNAVSYKNAVGPSDTIKWTVTMNNDGTYPMYEYTVTDCLPYPYVFKGNVTLKVYTASGSLRSTHSLFTIPEHDHSATQLKLSNTWTVKYGTLSDPGNWAILMERVEVNGKQCEQMSIRMDADAYAIPEGGYVELTFDSYNPTTGYENTVYTNHATLTPNASQPFTMASQGSIVRDENDNPVSVTASAPINVSFGYATGAEKRVTQKGTSNTAASTDDRNYIYIPDDDTSFTYSLTVQNDSGKAMSKLVFIDNLPEVGDRSPFDTNAWRESQFKVKFADNPNVTVTITSENGESTTLPSTAYTVQYQKRTTFGDKDWDGTTDGTDWGVYTADARSIRVVILDETGVTIPEDVSITVSFDAKIDGEASEDQIAWNSFGYHYGLCGISTELEAMPMSVGVKIGKPPTLQKELKTYWGEDYAAEEDSEFRFLVYTGDPLTEEYDSDEELMEALTAAGRSYKQFAVTVSKGQTSELTPMSATGWRWSYGQKYTIVELDTGSKYSCDNFNGQNYTFTYYPNDPESILCQNLMMRWSIDLTKVGEESKPLSGAVFALYSPNPEEQMETSYHLALSNYVTLSDQPASTITDDNGTWYLKDVQTSDADGKITFRDLFEEEYKLIEVSAPEGYYNTHKKGQIITRTDYAEEGVASVTLINKKLLVMPQTGGIGAYLPMFAGVLLLFIATCLLFFRKRKDPGAK